MFRKDAAEAVPIINVTLDALLMWTVTRGRPGADLRTAVGDVKANLLTYLYDNTLGPPLVRCFDLAVDAGVTLPQMLKVQDVALEADPETVGAIVVQDSLAELCLASIGTILTTTKFVSRQDVDALKDKINSVYGEIEEDVADQLDSSIYMALIAMHAAIIAYLVETARPLPRMLNFRFGMPQPTLVMAYKLYADAGRADELRSENKVVHPAFARPFGRALSG